MLYYYVVEIGGNEEIKLGGELEPGKLSQDLTYVDVMLDTKDDSVSEKSNSMLARVTVKGKITTDTNPELLKVFAWAHDYSKETTYRNVKITVYEDVTTILRTYELEKIFVRDYKEIYDTVAVDNKGENSTGRFELYMTQQDNMLEKIKTYR